jgi:hypothetical protein
VTVHAISLGSRPCLGVAQMGYLLYLVMDGDGLSLVLVSGDEPRPHGESRLIRAFPSRQTALDALGSLQEEFVLPVQRCLAR